MKYLTFYHIHRGFFPLSLEYELDMNYGLFYSKIDSIWFKIEKAIGLYSGYGGYRIYKIEIPSNSFTTSLSLGDNNKIYKVTLENYKEYKKFSDKNYRFKGIEINLLVLILQKKNIVQIRHITTKGLYIT